MDFITDFKSKASALIAQVHSGTVQKSNAASLESDPITSTGLLREIARLEDELQNAKSSLTSYDLASCMNTLQELRRMASALSSSSNATKTEPQSTQTTDTPTEISAPRTSTSASSRQRNSRFAFSNKTKIDKRPISAATIPDNTTLKSNTPAQSNVTDTKGSFVDLDRRIINFQQGTTAVPNVRINNVANSIIVLQDPPYKAMYVTNCKDSIIIISTRGSNENGLDLTGSCFVENCSNCVFVLTPDQYRIHDTAGSDFILNPSCSPIIEKCNSLRFIPFHKNDPSQTLSAIKVQDFDHINKIKSPSYEHASIKESASSDFLILLKKFMLDKDNCKGCSTIDKESLNDYFRVLRESYI